MSLESFKTAATTLPEGQLFRFLIREAAANTANRASVLADVYHECTYPQIPAYLEEIQRFLVVNRVSPLDCITVELNNSVRAALSILSVLDAGYSFLITPVPGQGALAGGNSIPAARFCRWILTVNTDKPAAMTLAAPESYLRIVANPEFDPASKMPTDEGPHIFFRTSGSLGAPKLAKYRYVNFYRNLLNALEHRQFNASHRIALPTPIFHGYGLGAGLIAGLGGGASIDLQERSNVLKYLEREADFQPNVAYVTPSFCETLVRGRRSTRAYQFMITGGDCTSESTFRRCEDLHGPLINQYGTTEMGVVSACKWDLPYDLRSRTVGRPVEGVEYRIVETPAAIGTQSNAGELQIRHAYGFEGYVDLNGNKLVPEKSFDGEWYRTGDLAMAGPDGTLIVLGRCDLSVNRNGVLLPLADVESRMRELAGVDEVAVAPGPNSIRGRALIAFCVTSRGVQVTGLQLRASYASKAPPYSVPDVVHVLAALPKLGSGKVDRLALARLAEEIVRDGAVN